MIICECRIHLGYVQVVYFLKDLLCLIPKLVPTNNTPHCYAGTCYVWAAVQLIGRTGNKRSDVN